jgi:hypothetical protein
MQLRQNLFLQNIHLVLEFLFLLLKRLKTLFNLLQGSLEELLASTKILIEIIIKLLSVLCNHVDSKQDLLIVPTERWGNWALGSES